MSVSSMTGFANRDGGGEGYRWTWDIRTLNGKSLEIRLRLPVGFDGLELPVRQRLADKVTRGNVQATLTAEPQNRSGRFRINEDALTEIVAAMEQITKRIDIQPPTLDGIMSLRGVVDMTDAPDAAQRERLMAMILSDMEICLEELVAERVREGSAIATVLRNRLNEIETLVRMAEISPSRTPEAIKARLSEQASALIDAVPTLDPDRLYQEAVLLATKVDIREELDRLHAHLAAARDMLAGPGVVGRRLGFLAQEFNREVNTLCAKVNDRSLIVVGLELKAIVDQFREQVQNLE